MILNTSILLLLAITSKETCGQILWERVPGTGGSNNLPQDCVKDWGVCYYIGIPSSPQGSYIIQEYKVVPERNGGTCDLESKRYCDESCTREPPCAGAPVDCVKRWGECYVFGSESYRIEEVVVAAQNGGSCVLNYEFGCRAVAAPVDCQKEWGPCRGVGVSSFRDEIIVKREENGGQPCTLAREYGCNLEPVNCRKRWGPCRGQGPESVREEIVVTPARNGGRCNLREEKGCRPNKPVNCKKKWGECVGFGPESSRTQVIVTPAENGGKCVLRTQKGCNKQQPVDCVKRWGQCIGEGPGSFQDEEIVEPAKFGGKCNLRRRFGCNIPDPVDCVKEWGDCAGEGPGSFQDEKVVESAKFGGTCELKRRFGCNPYKPVDCQKRWGRCVGSGPSSTRREIVVVAARHGGKCELNTERGCNVDQTPVDCLKKWGPCIGKGPSSFRDQEVVRSARFGGECTIEREFGCDKSVDCVKKWGPCIGSGPSSYRMEEIGTKEEFGGKPCADFKRETGCNTGSSNNTKDSAGKKVANLLIANFISESGSDERSSAPLAGSSARSLISFNFESDKKQDNCTEYTDDAGNVLAVGCDNVDDIDKTIIEEEDKRAIRKGEKEPTFLPGRRKRQVANTKPRDVLFLLDSSGSVGPQRFSTLKEVSKAILDVLCGRITLAKYQTRAAMATFNARQLLSFPFSTTSSTAAVKADIDRVGFDYEYSYQSCIKDALNFVLTEVYLEKNNARDPSYAEGDMFIMTDGCANCDISEGNKELQRMAYRLKLNKINVYAIGVGLEENCKKILQVLARGGRCFHFFYLDNWDVDVGDFLQQLKNPPEDRCLDRWEFPGINCLEQANRLG